MTDEKKEEIRLLAFYQSAWSRYFFLLSEIMKCEAHAQTAYMEMNPDGNESAQKAFVGIVTEKTRAELAELAKTLEPEKYLK